jgi:hypothetical protein
MSKKGIDNKLVVVGLIVAVMLAVSGKLPGIGNQGKQGTEGASVQVELYDENGNLVKTLSVMRPFSIVESVAGISNIGLSVVVKNTGQVPLDFSFVTVSPAEFDTALDKTAKTAQPGETVIWNSKNACTSDNDCAASEKCIGTPGTCLIGTAQFESRAQPTLFQANLNGQFTCPVGTTCQSSTGTVSGGQTGTVTKIGQKALNIYAEGQVQVDFTVDVTSDIGGGTCLATGTGCSNNDQCCSLFCKGNTVETKTTVYPKTRITSPSFTCPSTGYLRCELYQVEEKTGASTWTPITPILKATCGPGVYCSYLTNVMHGFEGYGISATTNYACA